jgi:DNA primase
MPTLKQLFAALEKVAAKDPKRWQETIIYTPQASLTKQDVHDYYDERRIRDRILAAVGGREAILRQSFNPQNTILRRKDGEGNFIRLDPERMKEWNERRMSEVHPTFGRQVDFVLADIDPQGKVPWKKTKTIAETVAKTMQSHPDVQNVEVQFTGGRGFYVKGQLDKSLHVDRARKLSQDILKGVASRPDVTFGVAQPDQIRLDMTPLKRRGSIRAPYSLNASTGLVSAPVKLEDLPDLKKEDFTVDKILAKIVKTAAAEFAPGIPKSRKIHTIPEVNQPTKWHLVVQEHDAHKAGKHWDLRLVDPESDLAHSFAVPRHRLPTEKDRMLLAVQQPTHTADYALKFQGTIPAGVYGAGKVKRKLKERVTISKSNDDRIRFKRPNGEAYTLFRTEGNNWGIRRTS